MAIDSPRDPEFFRRGDSPPDPPRLRIEPSDDRFPERPPDSPTHPDGHDLDNLNGGDIDNPHGSDGPDAVTEVKRTVFIEINFSDQVSRQRAANNITRRGNGYIYKFVKSTENTRGYFNDRAFTYSEAVEKIRLYDKQENWAEFNGNKLVVEFDTDNPDWVASARKYIEDNAAASDKISLNGAPEISKEQALAELSEGHEEPEAKTNPVNRFTAVSPTIPGKTDKGSQSQGSGMSAVN